MIERTPLESERIRTEAVPACPVCGDPGASHLRDVTDRLMHVPGLWRLHRCRRDANLWLNPRPIEADLGLCYPGGYFTHSAHPASAARSGRRARSLKERMRRLVLAGAYGYGHLSPGPGAAVAGRLLALLPPVRWESTHHLGAFMPPYVPAGRLLDVGCGNGQYLARMRGYGWEVAGIEVDAEAAAVARQEYGLEVHGGTVEDAPYPPASFDVVACQHVLEHIGEPRPFLEGLACFLKPGGRLLVVTPNALSLGHRLYGRDCYSLDPPRHLVLHTPGSLRRLVGQVPALCLASLRTHARIARKIYLQRRVLQQTGAFRGTDGRPSLRARLGALLFAYTETAGSPLLSLGEELELVAIRT